MRRDSTSSFYHFNHLGTALALTGPDEAVTHTYRHDAWGVLLETTGSTVNPHTYVGRERYYRMPHADMYHLGSRDYASGLAAVECAASCVLSSVVSARGGLVGRIWRSDARRWATSALGRMARKRDEFRADTFSPAWANSRTCQNSSVEGVGTTVVLKEAGARGRTRSVFAWQDPLGS